ncbi:hypothetical protein GIB67_015944 [Kingdonia uniflora]|uniref:Uncharacterized protein n=1 Tax=Kingdonia uniflora TaxID=39325 RepID=A0A7J7PCC7_9MAGN|nr:hypothetical protein GIB67_015944 [Kingdonia uniflora]
MLYAELKKTEGFNKGKDREALKLLVSQGKDAPSPLGGEDASHEAENRGCYLHDDLTTVVVFWQLTLTTCSGCCQTPQGVFEEVLIDELLGLAKEPGEDQIYKNQSLDMDILYSAGETQKVITYLLSQELCNHSMSEAFTILGLAYIFQLAYINLLNSKVSLYSSAPNSPVSNAFHEHD